jgi:hypothetical protein
MTVARSHLVDMSVTRYRQCLYRCVRRARLCAEGFEHQKQWIEDRLERLWGCFAVSVCGFAVMLCPLEAGPIRAWRSSS